MGLAASQARFLGITARKTNCEYKSTDLAQQKLNITNQISAISNEYANAINATKLIWSNDTVADVGLNYSLLMIPSAANDYNPYLITTKSGAIVLNNEYAAAAKAAGISKCGGIGSQDQRDKFIAALSATGVITKETAQSITKTDYDSVKFTNGVIELGNVANSTATSATNWNPFAGMGAEPMNKSTVNAMQLSDLILSENFGQMQIDWNALIIDEYIATQKPEDVKISTMEYENELKRFDKLINSISTGNIISNYEIISRLEQDKEKYENTYTSAATSADGKKYEPNYNTKIAEFNEMIAYAKNGTLTNTTTDYPNLILKQLITDKSNYEKDYKNKHQDFLMKDAFNVNGSKLEKGYNFVVNNIKVNSLDSLKELTIGDLLCQNITIVSNRDVNTPEGLNTFNENINSLFTSIVRTFGYSPDENLFGQGLNLDEASSQALEFAYNMAIRQFSKTTKIGSQTDKSLTSNSAFLYSSQYNTTCTDSNQKYAAINLSNMLSAFLTYYDNALSGLDSPYLVAKSVEESIYVTDNLDYYYIAQDDEEAAKITNRERNSDFFDQLYNNILAHGWREDAAIDDSEYLESVIKDGRYSMSSLNEDGYFYQTRYNETGYMVEVPDTDAIARAEAEFTAKKAELTYKEDSIDMKSKKLDAEIAALNAEYDSVKSLIQKGIDLAFKLYQ